MVPWPTGIPRARQASLLSFPRLGLLSSGSRRAAMCACYALCVLVRAASPTERSADTASCCSVPSLPSGRHLASPSLTPDLWHLLPAPDPLSAVPPHFCVIPKPQGSQTWLWLCCLLSDCRSGAAQASCTTLYHLARRSPLPFCRRRGSEK